MGIMDEKEFEKRLLKITMMDLVAKKATAAEENQMSPALAACFSHAAELLGKDPNIFQEEELVLQGGGSCVSLPPAKYFSRRILRYDDHLKVVHDDMAV